MRVTTLHNTIHFTLTSYGNGTAYLLDNKHREKGLLFQGDDARAFEQSLANLTEGAVRVSYNDALHAIWNDYSEITVEVKA